MTEKSTQLPTCPPPSETWQPAMRTWLTVWPLAGPKLWTVDGWDGLIAGRDRLGCGRYIVSDQAGERLATILVTDSGDFQIRLPAVPKTGQ